VTRTSGFTKTYEIPPEVLVEQKPEKVTKFRAKINYSVWIWYSEVSVAKIPGKNTRNFGRTIFFYKTINFGLKIRNIGFKQHEASVRKPEVSFEKPKILVEKQEILVRKPEVSVRKPEVSVQKPEVSGYIFELETSVKVIFRNAPVAETRNLELLCT
jgi:hypothetical protein